MKKFLTITCLFALTLLLFSTPILAADLTYWEPLDGGVAQSYTSLGETPLYQELEKRTGIEVEFIHPPAGAGNEPFTLLLASGDLPDLIYWNSWNWDYPGAPQKLLDDEIAMPLNDLIDQHAPNFKKLMEEHPEWRKAATTDDGTYWCFPFIRGDEELMVFFGPILRKDLLDELGLTVPETIDEWYTVLTALKEKVKYPLMLGRPRNIHTGHNFIGAYKIEWRWFIDEGTVKYGPYEPAYKDFLAMWSQWYAEGLIHPDFLTNEAQQVDAGMLNSESAAMVGFAGSNIGRYLDAKKDEDSKFDLVGAPNVVLVKGEKPWTGQIDVPIHPRGGGLVVSTQAKDPVTAVKWADYLYSEEGKILMNFGIEGESFEWVEDYPGFEGEKFPKYTEEITNNAELGMRNSMVRYVRSAYNGPFVQDKRYIFQYYEKPQQREAWAAWTYSDANLHKEPPFTMTVEESQEFGDIMAQVNTYVEEMYARFTLGQDSLDGFDKYLEQLKKLGLERAIEIRQIAYERYMAK
jgi:putative aldouronate transport system substrate-binding protein